MLKILIVEDEKLIAMDLKLTLKRFGVSYIKTVSNGNDAIKLSENENFDLIIMDINILGDIDGIKTAEIIQKTKKIPVVFCTAYADFLIKDKVKNIHYIGLLEKPFMDNELSDVIKKVISDKKNIVSQELYKIR